MTGRATPYRVMGQSGSGIEAPGVQESTEKCPKRPYELTERRPILPTQDMGRTAGRDTRKRWHILDDWFGTPLCGRIEDAAIAECRLYDDVSDQRICGHCWGRYSWQPMPHDYEERDCGYTTQCWIWTRGADRDGYGKRMIPNGSRAAAAHRGAYEAAHGAIPDGFVVHHRCDQPACVNPDHLEAMSRADHVRLHRAGKPFVGGRRV